MTCIPSFARYAFRLILVCGILQLSAGCESEGVKDFVGIKRPYSAIDWPEDGNGRKATADRWLGGVFYGIEADKIRRVARPEKIGVDADSIKFYVRIPLDEKVYQELMDTLRFNDDYAYWRGDFYAPESMVMKPEWFPAPTEANYVSTAKMGVTKGSPTWSFHVFRADDSALHLFSMY